MTIYTRLFMSENMKKTNPTSRRLGKNLRDLRTMLGYSQLSFAHALGYKGGDAGAFISRVEAGKQMPKVPTLIRMADKLGTTLEALLAK